MAHVQNSQAAVLEVAATKPVQRWGRLLHSQAHVPLHMPFSYGNGCRLSCPHTSCTVWQRPRLPREWTWGIIYLASVQVIFFAGISCCPGKPSRLIHTLGFTAVAL